MKAGVIGLSAAILLTQAAPVLAADSAVPMAADAEPTKQSAAAQAAAKIDREQAIELARQFVSVPEDYVLDGVHFNSSEGEGREPASWRLSFTKQNDDRYHGNINVSVSADSGKLLSFNVYDEEGQQKTSYPPEVSMEEAKEIAESFIRKMNPENADKVVFDQRSADGFKIPLQGSFEYPIRYHRVENGLVYERNYIRLSIDGNGHIRNYRYEWDDHLEFAELAEVISEEEARAAITARDPQLVYQVPYRAKERLPILTYGVTWLPIDALTGKPVQEVPDGGSSEPLTAEPLAPMPEGGKKLTKEQAVQAIVEQFPLPDGAVLEDASYNENIDPETGTESAFWNLSWSVKDEEGMQTEYIWANVDSATGIVRGLDYSLYRTLDADSAKEEEEDAAALVSQAKVEEAAVALVKEVLPFYTDQLVLQQQEELAEEEQRDVRSYRVFFNRVVDGVQVNGERVRLSYDAKTGELTGFSNDFSDIDYPETKPEVIGSDEAMALLLSNYDLELQYEWTPSREGVPGIPIEKLNLMIAAGELPPSAAAGDGEAIAKPVYRLVEKYREERVMLDAQSGEWRVANTGEATVLEKQEVTDIAGHWAEDELELMLAYDALDVTDGKALPDQAITRGEMIKMLVIAIQGGHHPMYMGSAKTASFADVAADSAYFSYVETAVDMNLLDREEGTFKPTDTITREQLAGLIVKALGYAKLAEVEGLFALETSDMSSIEAHGEVALITALDILTLNGDGAFRPDEEVTRAQAATAFYRYLEKREALRDNMRF